jgi:hypothetical protein
MRNYRSKSARLLTIRAAWGHTISRLRRLAELPDEEVCLSASYRGYSLQEEEKLVCQQFRLTGRATRLITHAVLPYTMAHFWMFNFVHVVCGQL